MADNQRNIKIGKLIAGPIERIGDNSERRVEEAKHSGKIILPPSALRRVHLTNQTLMIFKLINEGLGRFVFCGVFSFDGEEKNVFVPLWILKQLQTNAGDTISVELVMSPIQKGHFAKFEPMTKSFLQITDPKAVLEHCLRSYVCISREDIISIYYNKHIYELKVCETLPSDTIVINECDLTVDFQEMKESIELPEECDLDRIQSQTNRCPFQAFSGSGQRTNGLEVKTDQNGSISTENENQSMNRFQSRVGIPDYDYRIGSIFFKRYKSDLIRSDPKPIPTFPSSPLQVKPDSNEQRPQSSTNQVTLNHENNNNNSPLPRRPVTRSQTRKSKTEPKENHMKTDATENTPPNQKRRKKNDKTNDKNQ